MTLVKEFTWVLLVGLCLVGSMAQASQWSGENGLVRLCFVENEPMESTLQTEAGDKGVVIVDVYAYLSDLDPIKKDGEAFMAIGAVEMNLVIEGAEGFITSQEFPQANRSVGRRPGEIIAGFSPGLLIKDGRTLLVHWQVLFQGTPKNVVFRVEAKNGMTAQRTESIAKAGSYALYTGTEAAHQLGFLLGAGYVPAYLNFEGDVDLEPHRGLESWADVGVFEKR